jgi:hypothetical protein
LRLGGNIGTVLAGAGIPCQYLTITNCTGAGNG